MSEIKLLPCPFCGSKARLDSQDRNTLYLNPQVECSNILCGVWCSLDRWNTRAENPHVAELEDFLKAEIDGAEDNADLSHDFIDKLRNYL